MRIVSPNAKQINERKEEEGGNKGRKKKGVVGALMLFSPLPLFFFFCETRCLSLPPLPPLSSSGDAGRGGGGKGMMNVSHV